MPRDSSGSYTLPTGNPVVSGTVIASSWANPTMDDLAAAMTDSLSRTGNGAMQAPLKHTNGVQTSPSQTFNNDPITGRYLFNTSDMRDTVQGTDIVRYTPEGLSVSDGEGGWVPVLGSGSGAILIQTDFTDVAGQTVFTTAEANSSADCYINGSLLANADYTFTLGNTITLVEPVKSDSDVVSILGYGAFDITDPAGAREQLDVYSTEESDAGDKNYLINGGMTITQRGQSFVSPSDGEYTLDRWFVRNQTSATFTIAQSGYNGVDSRGTVYAGGATGQVMTISCTSGSSGSLSIRQRIEDLADFGATVTISVCTRLTLGVAGSATLADISLVNRAGETAEGVAAALTDPIVLVNDVPTWYSVTVNIPDYTGANNTYTSTELAVGFAGLEVGDRVDILAIQLTSGSIAKPFIYTPIGETLALCQRYYCTGETSYMTSGNGTTQYINTPWPVAMRAAPSTTTLTLNNNPDEVAVPLAMTSLTVNGNTRLSYSATPANNSRVDMSWTADAEL